MIVGSIVGMHTYRALKEMGFCGLEAGLLRGGEIGRERWSSTMIELDLKVKLKRRDVNLQQWRRQQVRMFVLVIVVQSRIES